MCRSVAMRFILWFTCDAYSDFILAEVDSLLYMQGLNPRDAFDRCVCSTATLRACAKCHTTTLPRARASAEATIQSSPFLIVELPSIESALALASRSVMLRSVCVHFADGRDFKDVSSAALLMRSAKACCFDLPSHIDVWVRRRASAMPRLWLRSAETRISWSLTSMYAHGVGVVRWLSVVDTTGVCPVPHRCRSRGASTWTPSAAGCLRRCRRRRG